MNDMTQPVPAGCTLDPDGETYMRDGKSRLVPLKLVKDIDQLEDQLVRKILGFADALNAQIGRFKGHTFDDIDAFLGILSEKYGVKPKPDAKGNVAFKTYDDCCRVKVAVADILSFGPELQVAKSLIDECIAEWAVGSRDEIRALVEHAFRVDKQGQVNREAIFSLRKIAIEDPRWKSAMQAIGDSVRITGSKTYITFHRRAKPTDVWRLVTIAMASAVDARAAAEPAIAEEVV